MWYIDAGVRKITNPADGVGDIDTVNKRQLYYLKLLTKNGSSKSSIIPCIRTRRRSMCFSQI